MGTNNHTVSAPFRFRGCAFGDYIARVKESRCAAFPNRVKVWGAKQEFRKCWRRVGRDSFFETTLSRLLFPQSFIGAERDYAPSRQFGQDLVGQFLQPA